MIFKAKHLDLIVQVNNKNSPYYQEIGIMIDCESFEYYTIEFKDGTIIEDIEKDDLIFLGILNNKTKKRVF